MRISDSTIESLLGREQLATADQITSLKEQAARLKRPLQEVVLDERVADEKTLVQAFSRYTDIPFIELDTGSIPTDVLQLLPERVARQYNAIVFKKDEEGVHHLAMEDPDDVQTINFIQKELGTNTKIYIATKDNILETLELYRGDVNKELNEVIDIQREDGGESQMVTEEDIAEDSAEDVADELLS